MEDASRAWHRVFRHQSRNDLNVHVAMILTINSCFFPDTPHRRARRLQAPAVGRELGLADKLQRKQYQPVGALRSDCAPVALRPVRHRLVDNRLLIVSHRCLRSRNQRNLSSCFMTLTTLRSNRTRASIVCTQPQGSKPYTTLGAIGRRKLSLCYAGNFSV